jgi:adenylyltransferase/sulfurtransferase
VNPETPSERIPERLARYSRQIRFPGIGLQGQQRIADSAAMVIGCGALGSVVAESLVRAGAGLVRLVDRDFVELHNLQRQVLYDESDVKSGLPKSIAAQRKLQAINSSIRIEASVADLDHRNIGQLAAGVDVLVDGTDNFETRFLINDYALETGVPWIYGGCLGSEGQTMTIVPGRGNCLHCLMTDGPPPPGTTAGCDVAGILGPVVNVIASIEAAEALKILSGNIERVSTDLAVVDLWSGRWHKMQLGNLADRVQCPACRGGIRAWLSGDRTSHTAVLCGREAVQIRSTRGSRLDLRDLENRLTGHGSVKRNEFLLKFETEENVITVFEDGRAIIGGTDDPARARSLYARWIGI